MKQAPKNVATSVHARLLAGARARREDFNRTLQRYVAERFLYRLGASRHREQFVLKGAMLFALWSGSLYRATRDLDLTGYAKDDPQTRVATMQEICAVPCADDGLTFRAETVRAEPIRDRSEYRGFRVRLQVLLGTARLTRQIDVGFGDAIEPAARDEKYPVLIEGPVSNPCLSLRSCGCREGSRDGDARFGQQPLQGFLRVHVLAKRFSFPGSVLARVITATFERRRTRLTEMLPVVLTAAFYSAPKRGSEWQRYLSRNALPGASPDFALVGEQIQAFLGSVWSALADSRSFSNRWPAASPWPPANPSKEPRS